MLAEFTKSRYKIVSRIGKGIKKVFRGVKKVLKKVAKPALIVGGAFFASGLALGGFKGFSNLLDNNNIFEAVGKTLGAGAQAIGGAFGIGEGVSPELLSEMGVDEDMTLGKALFGDSSGLKTPSTAEEATKNATEVAGDKTANKGLIGNIFSGFNNLSDPVQAALLRGVGTGFQAYMASEEAKKERRRQRQRGVFGVPFGSEFGPGISPEEIRESLQPMQYAYSPGNQEMPAPPQTQPRPQQAYPNPYTTPPPPQSSGPLLG